MVSLRTKTSVRVPSFSGPMVLSAALLIVACFSEPFWQNFYTVQATGTTTRMKLGHWGSCVFLRNTTGIMPPNQTAWCTPISTGWVYNFVQNTTGPNDFPQTSDANALFGIEAGAIEILTTGQTALFWFQPIAALVCLITVITLLVPPSYLGSPQSRLFAFQKSGVMTIVLSLASLLLTIIAFAVDLAIIIPTANKLSAIDGISAQIGNVQWFTLPCILLQIVALFSVLMSPSKNEYQDL